MKANRFDWVVTVLFVAVLVAGFFAWGCALDGYITALAAVILLVTLVVRIAQNKKLKELTEGKEEVKQQ